MWFITSFISWAHGFGRQPHLRPLEKEFYGSSTLLPFFKPQRLTLGWKLLPQGTDSIQENKRAAFFFHAVSVKPESLQAAVIQQESVCSSTCEANDFWPHRSSSSEYILLHLFLPNNRTIKSIVWSHHFGWISLNISISAGEVSWPSLLILEPHY